MKDKSELGIKCCSGSKMWDVDSSCRPDRNIVGGRGARRSAPRGKRSSTNDICFRVDMTRHSSSCFGSTTISSCRAVRKVVCWGSPLKTVPSFKLLPPHLDYMS